MLTLLDEGSQALVKLMQKTRTSMSKIQNHQAKGCQSSGQKKTCTEEEDAAANQPSIKPG